MANTEYIPSAGTGYVDWSRNITPMIQSWVDLAKYKQAKQDQLNLAILPALINAGWLGPSDETTKAYPGLRTITGEERAAQTGKSSEMLKNYYDAMYSMQRANWLNKMGGLMDNAMGSTGGYELIPSQLDVSTGGPTLNYMFNKKETPQPGLIDRLKSLFTKKNQPAQANPLIDKARKYLQTRGRAGTDQEVAMFLSRYPDEKEWQ